MNCFKAYDIRGSVPEELDQDIAYKIGCGYARIFQPSKIIVGYDVRHESKIIAAALIQGLTESGIEVINIGLCGTEEVYFQTFHRQSLGVDGGIMVTASHNPKGYSGMKLVREGSTPISSDTGLFKIRDFVEQQGKGKAGSNKSRKAIIDNDKTAYIDHLLGYVNRNNLKPLKIVVNPGNGPAGIIIKLLAPHLPFEFIYINDEPDGDFPNGVPNPIIKENQVVTSAATIKYKADLGIAWDGDFDRCFLFDQNGQFIEGYYVVGLLAAAFLRKHPGEKIIHDPRLTWNTIDIVKNAGGKAIQSKAGHAFIKEKMREEDAIYGGEMSAHHYFRDFAYCDSGMIPWLLVTELLSNKNLTLSNLVTERISTFPCSGEINYQVSDPDLVLKKIMEHFSTLNPKIDHTDGIGLEFEDWRCNIRKSNTEPLIRLNIEAKGHTKHLINKRLKEIESLIFSI